MFRHHLPILLMAGLLWMPAAHASDPVGVFQGIDQTTGVGTGSASDADRPGQSILVDFWLGSGFTTYVGQTATQASSGAFSFQIPSQYRDGQSRSFCAWAINNSGPHVPIGCKTFTQTDRSPTGTFSGIDPGTAIASGTASDPDAPGQSIKVDFWLGSGFSTYAGQALTTASNGSFGFAIPQQYRDGQSRSFCAWAISDKLIAAPTAIGCMTFAYVNRPPTGSLAGVDANGRARGTTSDPDSPGQSLRVDFWIGRTFENTNNYLGQSTTSTSGTFSFQIPESRRTAVKQELCTYAIDAQGGPASLLGCAYFVKPGLKYLSYFTSSTPFRLGYGDHTSAVTDHTNLAWIESNDCWVISSDEDQTYCQAPHGVEYQEPLPSGRRIDFYDLMARVRNAAQRGDKAVIHIEQFLFVFPQRWAPNPSCVYLREDADQVIEAISRQLKRHGLMDTVEVVYPIDEPYLRAVSLDVNNQLGTICRSSTDRTPLGTAEERKAEMFNVMTRVLASIRANDSQTGVARFPNKKTAVIFSYEELGWSNIHIPEQYDWVGYDGYIASGEYSQNYSYYLQLLKGKLAMLPNGAAKKILLVPEAYIQIPESDYSGFAAQCDSSVMAQYIPGNDGHRLPECILLSNFLRAYKTALCDPSIVAIVPFLWQEGVNKAVPLSDTANRYKDMTQFRAVARTIGQGVSAAAGGGIYAIPDVTCQ